MRVLAIAGRIPAVDRNGDQVISYFRLTHLARHNTVELICFGDSSKDDDAAAVAVLEGHGIVVHLIQWNMPLAALHVLMALPDRSMPFQCAYFRSSAFAAAFSEVTARFTPDVLYSVMIRILPNAPGYRGRLFVDMVDSMGLNFGRRATMQRGLKGWLLGVEARRVAAFEKATAERAERCYVVSRIDQQAIGSNHVGVLPLGIDMQRFQPSATPITSPLLAFTGNMFYQPNVDAVLWFAEQCWPAIKAAVPGVRLVIVGNAPQPSVVALGKQDSAIDVMGRVPSMAAILKTAAVAIAPMRSGSGMQFKILEAMACAVPVVATTIGLGDIGAQAGTDIVIRDDGRDFAAAVIELLGSPEKRDVIGRAGMKYVQQHHSWDAINSTFVDECGLLSSGTAT
ncbi:MAG: glycosyl transferase group 1 family protein [Massilia sp.]|jgi:glycosyltransferase involved in cell wall biosynthesis|nr:glycosyl transferase group 1 family protein [Massilia sp.]